MQGRRQVLILVCFISGFLTTFLYIDGLVDSAILPRFDTNKLEHVVHLKVQTTLSRTKPVHSLSTSHGSSQKSTQTKSSVSSDHVMISSEVNAVREKHCENLRDFDKINRTKIFSGSYLEDYVKCALEKENLKSIAKNPIAELYLTDPICINYRMKGYSSYLTESLGKGRRVRCYRNKNSNEYQLEHGGGLLVSHTYRIVYIQNMKAASQSIRTFMEEVYDARNMNQNSFRNEIFSMNLTLTDYLVFTIVRDPVSHFISAYSEVDKRLTVRHKPVANNSFLEISRDAYNEPRRAIQALNNIRRGDVMGFTPSHMYTQFWKISRCLSRIKYPLLPNYIGRLHTIEEDILKLQDMVNERLRVKLPTQKLKKVHVSENDFKRHAKGVVLPMLNSDSLLKSHICEYYKVDFHCFGYSLELCK